MLSQIVGSSVALVLSLWDTLRTIRYFPFLIFVAMTSAVFGAGLYAHHRWKLESTSRGLLAIATLLVPLNFLAMAAFSKQDADLVTLLIEKGADYTFLDLSPRQEKDLPFTSEMPPYDRERYDAYIYADRALRAGPFPGAG